MPPIINAQNIFKAFGAKLLSRKSFHAFRGRPNWSDRAQRLREVTMLRGFWLRRNNQTAAVWLYESTCEFSHLEQDSRFAAKVSVSDASGEGDATLGTSSGRRWSQFSETLGRAGFEDLELEAASLSGGWQKRLAIAEALADCLNGATRSGPST